MNIVTTFASKLCQIQTSKMESWLWISFEFIRTTLEYSFDLVKPFWLDINYFNLGQYMPQIQRCDICIRWHIVPFGCCWQHSKCRITATQRCWCCAVRLVLAKRMPRSHGFEKVQKIHHSLLTTLIQKWSEKISSIPVEWMSMYWYIVGWGKKKKCMESWIVASAQHYSCLPVCVPEKRKFRHDCDTEKCICSRFFSLSHVISHAQFWTNES